MFLYKLSPLFILVLILSCFDNTNGATVKRSMRSYFEYLDCPNLGGDYDVSQKRAISRLDRVCEDCYNLIHEPRIYTECRENCFANVIFKGCADTLLVDGDKLEQLKEDVITLHSYGDAQL
uniref:Venom protein 10 n=1 Tax=Microctonus hyperodae TaxID=165561 RepID=A9YME6_MICHY|nr:venom protein 10 [Microctonus hyperodae]